MVVYMCWYNKVIYWDFLFTGSVQDWEMEILQYFLVLLYSHIKLLGLGMTGFVGLMLGVVFLKLSPTVRLFYNLHGECPLFFQT